MYLSLCILFSVFGIQGIVGYRERLCVNPTLENGWVEAKQNARLDAYAAKLHCHHGFTLIGTQTVKCRNGILSVSPNNFPFCTAIGSCPDLPEIENGHKRSVRGYRNSVYRFRCNRGYKLYGSPTMYCTSSGWSSPHVPVCTKSGCDEEMVGELIHGRSKKMNGGGVFKFWCENGAIMEGPPVIICDGTNWNETAPLCLTPPGPPYLKMLVEGVAGTKAQAGQVITLICQSQGGNPTPELTFANNGEMIGSKETGNNAYSFTMEEKNDGNKFQCEAVNRVIQNPVGSQQVELKLLYAPKDVNIFGEDTVNHGDDLAFACTSDSQPPAQLTWVIKDEHFRVIDVTSEVSSSDGIAVSTATFVVDESVKIYSVQCVASNGLGDATRSKNVHVRYLPESISLDGPEEVSPETESVFNCSTQHSYPAATLTWKVDFPEDSDLVQLADNMHQDVELLLDDGSWMTYSSLSIPALDTAHANFKVQCVASVEGLEEKKESESHSVMVTYLPSSVSISGPDAVKVGEEVEYICNIEGGNPIPTAIIKIEDQYGSEISPSSETEYSVSLTIKDNHRAIHVSCFVSNLAGEMHAEKDSTVIYAPAYVAIDGKEEAEANTEIEYICKAGTSNPPSQLTWSVIDQDGNDVPVSATEGEPSSEGEIISSIRMRVEEKHQNINIACTASNPVSTILHQKSIQIYDGPKSVSINGAEMVNDGETAQYECISGVASPPAELTWEMTGLDGQAIDIATIDTGMEERAGWSKVSFKADRSQKIVRITCTASNKVGSMSQAQQVAVQYGPKSVSINGAEMVNDGETAEYECISGVASPPAELTWEMTGLDGHAIDVVTIDTGVEERAGWSKVSFKADRSQKIMRITCTASNKVGSISHVQQVAVQYGPETLKLIAPESVRASDETEVRCSSSESVPAADIVWTVIINGQEVELDQDEAEQVPTLMEDGGVSTYSSIKLPATGSAEITVRCKAVGDWPTVEQLVQQKTIMLTVMPGEPLIAGLRDGAEVAMDSEHVLTCSAEAGNPPATLRWFRGQEEAEDVELDVHGENVIAIWKYVAKEGDVELRCEASNEVTEEPLVGIVNIDVIKAVEVHLQSEKEKDESTNNKKWDNDEYYDISNTEEPEYTEYNEDKEYVQEPKFNKDQREEYAEEPEFNKDQREEYAKELEFNNDEGEEHAIEPEFNKEHEHGHETPIAPEVNPSAPAVKSSKSLSPIAEANMLRQASASPGAKSSQALITSILIVLGVSRLFL